MARRASRASKGHKKMETIKRAVLQFRVHQDEYDELVRSAREQKLTISEEAARRLRQYRFLYGRAPHAFAAELEPAQTQVFAFSAGELEGLVARAVTRGVELAMTSRHRALD